MKEKIHPKYYEKATIKCSCGASHIVGSTKEKMEIEICNECHPFYTGKEKLVDTAGRVEKFKSRREKATAKKVKGTKSVDSKKADAKKEPATKSTAKKTVTKKVKK